MVLEIPAQSGVLVAQVVQHRRQLRDQAKHLDLVVRGHRCRTEGEGRIHRVGRRMRGRR